MSTLREKLALKLHTLWGYDSWSDSNDRVRRYYLDDADEVLAVVREHLSEPSEGMLDEIPPERRDYVVRYIWQPMIDAALNRQMEGTGDAAG